MSKHEWREKYFRSLSIVVNSINKLAVHAWQGWLVAVLTSPGGYSEIGSGFLLSPPPFVFAAHCCVLAATWVRKNVEPAALHRLWKESCKNNTLCCFGASRELQVMVMTRVHWMGLRWWWSICGLDWYRWASPLFFCSLANIATAHFCSLANIATHAPGMCWLHQQGYRSSTHSFTCGMGISREFVYILPICVLSFKFLHKQSYFRKWNRVPASK
jgi:hypothetical protein